MHADSIYVPRPDTEALLDHLVEQSKRDGLTVLWMFGETGQGKTVFLRNALETRRNALIVSYASCAAPIGTESTSALNPYQPLKAIFEDLLRNYADSQRRMQLARNISLTVLAMIPVVGDFFYGIKELRRDLTEYRRGERKVDFSSFAKDCFSTLVRLADDAPVLVVIDDAQWADRQTALAIEEFCTGEHPHNKPITLIIAGRADEIDTVAPFVSMRARMARSGRAVEITLPPFDQAQVEGYFRASFPRSKPDPDMLLWLERKTGGNPFFLRSYLRHLVVERVLDEHGSVQGDLYTYSGVPSEVRLVTTWLMKSLEGEDLTLLLTASVLGYEFTLHELAHLTGRPALDLIRALRRIKATHGICDPAGYRLLNGRESTVYRFSQHAVHTALYNELTVEEKEQLHRETARYLNELRLSTTEAPEAMSSLASAMLLHARLGRQPELEYESLLLKARNTSETLDPDALEATLQALAPSLGVSLEDLHQRLNDALAVAPLVTRTMDPAVRDALLAARAEERTMTPEALVQLVSAVFTHLAERRASEAVRLLSGFIERQRSRDDHVHPLALILYAVALLVRGGEQGRAVEALRMAAGDTTQPEYAAFARFGLAVLAPHGDVDAALQHLRDVVAYEGPHARILRRAAAAVALARHGGDGPWADLADRFEQLRDHDTDLETQYPRTVTALRALARN